MQLTKEDFYLVIIVFLLANLFYKNGKKKITAWLKHFEPKTLTAIEFDSILKKPNPCDHFRNPKLIFTLPPYDLQKALRKLRDAGCFRNREFFLNVFDAALDNFKPVTSAFIFVEIVNYHHRDLLGTVFYKCARMKFYGSAAEAFSIDPLLDYEGKNVLHIAAELDDPKIFLIPREPIKYFHLRQKGTGDVPSKLIKTTMMAELFLKHHSRFKETSPYPLEVEAHMDYLRKTCELGFGTDLQVRLQYMFVNDHFIQFKKIYRLEVPREDHFEYSYKMLHESTYFWYSPNVYGNSYIKFKDEIAIDNSGVSNEWLSLLIETFFKANPTGMAKSFTAPLFQLVTEDSHLYAPTGLYEASVYKFAGSIVALGLKRGITTKVEFIPSTYRKILGIESFRIDDMEYQNPVVWKNLNSLRTSFEKNDPVITDYGFKTIDDVQKYINDYSAGVLYTTHKPYLKAFAEGFLSKIPRKITKYLDLNDLKVVLKGTVSISAEEFMNNVKIDPFTRKSRSETLLKVLTSFNNEEMFKLVRFITGKHGIPFGGLSELSPKISVNFDELERGKLPQAVTCHSILNLPKFKNAEELQKSMKKALEYCDTMDRV